MKIYKNIFSKIISLENLFLAWGEFKRDKRKKKDVLEFEWNLEENIFQLEQELKLKTYKHSSYSSFYIHDPKQRHIFKASVRDRVLHHAVFSVLNPIFELTYIPNSFSCRIGKGTHKGVKVLNKMLNKVSGNGHKQCFALKCDIKKFFDSIDHDILFKIISKRIKDKDALWLIKEVIDSYSVSMSIISERESNLQSRKGVPIGNLTSQLFANIYLNELDQFIKNELRVKYYVRYTDDFVIAADNTEYLHNLINPISFFLKHNFKLQLHPQKVIIRKFNQGVDFLGYVIRSHHRLVRTKTKKRIFRKIKRRVNEFHNSAITQQTLEQSLQSYLGVLSHANTYKLSEELKNKYWIWLSE